MSSNRQVHRGLPGGGWWLLVAVVFAAQLGAIFWLGDRAPIKPRPAAFSPALHVAGGANADFFALADPTLFALPHQQGFAGLAWLSVPTPPSRSFHWSEPLTWLELSSEALGAAFYNFLQTNLPHAPAGSLIAPLALTLPEAELDPGLPQSSTVRLTGELADWRLAGALELPSWPAADLLSNSVVRVMVSARGEPISAVLLGGGSGSREADDYALAQAMGARFVSEHRPLPRFSDSPLKGLVWGDLIFEWHTLPAAETNSPAR